MELIIGSHYRFKNQKEVISYIGKEGVWNQFSLVSSDNNPDETSHPFIWCEVLDKDLYMLEEVHLNA